MTPSGTNTQTVIQATSRCEARLLPAKPGYDANLLLKRLTSPSELTVPQREQQNGDTISALTRGNSPSRQRCAGVAPSGLDDRAWRPRIAAQFIAMSRDHCHPSSILRIAACDASHCLATAQAAARPVGRAVVTMSDNFGIVIAYRRLESDSCRSERHDPPNWTSG